MGRAGVLALAAAITLSLGAGAARAETVPGANTFTCHPSAAHPNPVVLLHGLGATAPENWGYISPKLAAAGYCVFALTYGVDPRMAAFGNPGGTVKMETSAPQIAAFVDRVRAATGAAKVDIVGHSEGTVVSRYYLERLGGAAKVQRDVAMTPLWRGTNIGGAAMLRDLGAPLGLSSLVLGLVGNLCGSCPEFLTGSPFLNDLNADGEAVPGITHTNIITRYDELVSPYTSGVMKDGGTNIVIQDVCPNDFSEHAAVAFDPVVVQLVENALDPAHATPVSC